MSDTVKGNFFDEEGTRDCWVNKNAWKSRAGAGHGMSIAFKLSADESKTYSAGTLSGMLRASVKPGNTKYTPHDINLLMDALNSYRFKQGPEHHVVSEVKAQISNNGGMA